MKRNPADPAPGGNLASGRVCDTPGNRIGWRARHGKKSVGMFVTCCQLNHRSENCLSLSRLPSIVPVVPICPILEIRCSQRICRISGQIFPDISTSINYIRDVTFCTFIYIYPSGYFSNYRITIKSSITKNKRCKIGVSIKFDRREDNCERFENYGKRRTRSNGREKFLSMED